MSQFERLQKAAALKYNESDPEAAPVVVASGSGCIAQKIINIAEQSGVPVFRDNSLATLLSQLQAGTEIPPEFYRAVVDIYVFFLGFRVDENGRVSRKAEPKQQNSTESKQKDL
jgi:flagellar biosynthesis protein